MIFFVNRRLTLHLVETVRLLAILRGDGANKSAGDEWLWINEAMKPLLAQHV